MAKNNSPFLIAAALILLCFGTAHAQTEKLSPISGYCLFKFSDSQVQEILAGCEPEKLRYDAANDTFFWRDPAAAEDKNNAEITFQYLGTYKDIYVFTAYPGMFRGTLIWFIRKTERPSFGNEGANSIKVLQMVGALSGGLSCDEGIGVSPWNGGRYLNVTYAYNLRSTLERFLSKDQVTKLKQDTDLINYGSNQDCFLSETRVIDLDNLSVKSDGFQIAGQLDSEIKPQSSNSSIPCLKTQLQALKAQKLTDTDIAEAETKEAINQIFETCKTSP